jgi:hypothetical protein
VMGDVGSRIDCTRALIIKARAHDINDGTHLFFSTKSGEGRNATGVLVMGMAMIGRDLYYVQNKRVYTTSDSRRIS